MSAWPRSGRGGTVAPYRASRDLVFACGPTAPPLAVAASGSIRIVSTGTTQTLFEEPGKIDPQLVAFDPSGSRFAVGGSSIVHIVDVATNKIVRSDLPGEAVGLAWGARAGYLAVLAVDTSHNRVCAARISGDDGRGRR